MPEKGIISFRPIFIALAVTVVILVVVAIGSHPPSSSTANSNRPILTDFTKVRVDQWPLYSSKLSQRTQYAFQHPQDWRVTDTDPLAVTVTGPESTGQTTTVTMAFKSTGTTLTPLSNSVGATAGRLSGKQGTTGNGSMAVIQAQMTGGVLEISWPSADTTGTFVPQIIRSFQLRDVITSVLYRSTALGIAFEYREGNGFVPSISETGSTVTVSVGSGRNIQTQSVTSFSNPTKTALLASVQNTILKGVDPKVCQAVSDTYVQSSFPTQAVPAGWDIVRLVWPVTNGQSAVAAAAKCPAGYADAAGLSYFAMNRKHPETYYFFRLGTITVLGTESAGWPATVRRL